MKWEPEFRPDDMRDDFVLVRVMQFPSRVLEFASGQLAAIDDAAGIGALVAIIAVAGTACEVGFASGLSRLLAYSKIEFAELRRPVESETLRRRIERLLDPGARTPITMMPPDQRDVWQDATGDDISDWEHWKRYLERVKVRNRIVHVGLLPGDEEPTIDAAREAVAVAGAMLAHQNGVLAHIGLPYI